VFEVAPAPQRTPALQGAHVSAEAAPVSAEKKPGGHCTQTLGEVAPAAAALE